MDLLQSNGFLERLHKFASSELKKKINDLCIPLITGEFQIFEFAFLLLLALRTLSFNGFTFS